MNTLHHEGVKYNIRVNTLVPAAATRMTEAFIAKGAEEVLRPEAVTPGVLFLASEEAPSKTILSVGAGVIAIARMVETAGVYLSEAERTPEAIVARFHEIADPTHQADIDNGWKQTEKFLAAATRHEGIELSRA